jgi:Protein of unknown function (DUF4011)
MSIPEDRSATRRARIARALDQARRDLVDPSRRNRLLHAPLSGKRPWCMALTGRDPDELFDTLYRQESFRGYGFDGRPEDETESGQEQKAKGAELPILDILPDQPSRQREQPQGRSGRSRLQTKLTQDKLEKRLTKIFREERTLEEEQGISTLYLALGFLKWFDSDQTQEPSFAPLILLPVTMVRGRGGNAPDFVEVGEAGIAVDHAMRRRLAVQSCS